MDFTSLPQTNRISPFLEGHLCAIHGEGGWTVTYQKDGRDLFGMTPCKSLQEAIDKLIEKIRLSPTPITPNWLEGNGYTPRESFGDIEWVSKDGQVVISQNSNSPGRDWCVHIDNQDFQTIGGMDIQEVWQLQATLRLAGREEG